MALDEYCNTLGIKRVLEKRFNTIYSSPIQGENPAFTQELFSIPWKVVLVLESKSYLKYNKYTYYFMCKG